jgi:hypothetical protein
VADANETTDSFSSSYTSSSNEDTDNGDKARAAARSDLKAEYDISTSLKKLDFLNNIAYLKIQGDQHRKPRRPREFMNAVEQRKSISIRSIIAQQEELFQNVQAASQSNSLGAKKMSTVMSESIMKNLDSTKDRELILPKLQKVKEPIIKA